jgi:acetyl-CoA decarbonylase/synthase complex subunit delta
MEYQAAIETYSGKMEEVLIGKGKGSLRIGGETTLPFHFFEGTLPNPPKLALEVSHEKQSDWPQEAFKAEIISLQLSDASGKDIKEIAATTAKIVKSVTVPVIVYGTGEPGRDRELLPVVAEACAGEGLLLGPAKKENYREIAAACLKYGHCLIAQTPLDVNATKQLNIMLTKEGISPDRIVIDPLSSALGYGMEYTYSVMERIKLAALAHNDKMMQMPIIANIGAECWKTKEAKEDDAQGILWEGITALCFILAGANIVVLRSPHTYKLVQQMLSKYLKKE